MNKKTLIPSQLFVGQKELLLEKTEKFLQQNFCKNKENQNLQDCFCNQCKKIKSQQHESIVFINPEKDYTVKDIEIIFEKTNLALDENQKFFFILQKANTLNLTCANRLLKVLEEPPDRYNFILHTNNINSILPTILSRCHIVNFVNEKEISEIDFKYTTLVNFFYKPSPRPQSTSNQDLDNPAEFEKELRKLHLTDSQSIEIADSMINYFAQKIIDIYKNNQEPKDSKLKYFKTVHEYLKEKMRKPPQSGSSNLFWKNLYLSFPQK